MNHGFIAFDTSFGAGVWMLAMEAGQWPAVYADRMVEAYEAARWAYARAAGLLLHYEYARYEPETEPVFSFLCEHAASRPRWAVAVPGEAADEAALELLRAFVSIQPQILRRLHRRWKVRPAVQDVAVTTPWAYVLGFLGESPYTIFLAPAAEVVERAAMPTEGVERFGILERW